MYPAGQGPPPSAAFLGVGVFAPPEQKYPASHSPSPADVVSPLDAQYFPAGQDLQPDASSVFPVVSLNVPGGHGVGAELPAEQ